MAISSIQQEMSRRDEVTTYAAAVFGALLGGLPEGSVDRLLDGHAAGRRSRSLEKLCRQVWALAEAMDDTRPG